MSILAELFTESRYFIWTFSLGFILTSLALMVGLVAGVDSKQINNDRLSSLKTWIITTNSVWILVLVAHIIFYEINLFGNIWIWIALFGADFVYLFVSLSYLGHLCYDHAYTPSGIDIIKPNFMVELSKERRKSIGKFILEPYTDSANSKPMFTDEEVELSLANHMIIWRKIPSSWVSRPRSHMKFQLLFQKLIIFNRPKFSHFLIQSTKSTVVCTRFSPARTLL